MKTVLLIPETEVERRLGKEMIKAFLAGWVLACIIIGIKILL